MLQAQTASLVRLISSISAIFITIANPKPGDAIQVSKRAIEIIYTTIHLN